MSKDENSVSYIEEFNRSHRRIKREEKDWYVMYLPRGLGMEDITEKEDRELMAIFTKAEGEMEKEFDNMVRDRFCGYFESLALVDILEFLPQKPVPILLETMKREDRNAIKEIYNEAMGSGYIKKTIRKQIRKYLDETGYLVKGKIEVEKEAEPEQKEDRKKPEKKPMKKKDFEQIDLDDFLPQKPSPIRFDNLDSEDKTTIVDFCRVGLEAGYVKKTIRKQIRKVLEKKGYFDREFDVGRETTEGEMKAQKKKKSKDDGKKKMSKDNGKGKLGKVDAREKKSKDEGKGKQDKVDAREKKSKDEGKGKLGKDNAKKKMSKDEGKGKLGKDDGKKKMSKDEGEGKQDKVDAKKKMSKDEGKGKKGKEKIDAKKEEKISTGKSAVSGDEPHIEEIIQYLPQKPDPFTLNSLKKKEREKVMGLIRDGIESKHVKKTIRKHVRQYLTELAESKGKTEVDTTIKRSGEPAKESSRAQKKQGKVGKKNAKSEQIGGKDQKEIGRKKKTGVKKATGGKKAVPALDLALYLPHKPSAMDFSKLKKADQKKIREICETGVKEGFITKTIRKQVRKYLVDNGYLGK